MKDKRCFVCKYQGKTNLETEPNSIFGEKKSQQSIPLCYSHSVELFKNGQAKFTTKYKGDMSEYIEKDAEDARAFSFF